MDCTFANLLNRLSLLEDSGFSRDLRINSFIEPACAVAVGAFAKDKGIELSQIVAGKAESYLASTQEAYRGGKTYFPLSNFSAVRGRLDELVKSLVNCVVSATDFNSEADAKDFEQYLSYSTLEILNNVADHSESHIGGFVAAQFYPATKKVQVAVADCGIGLYSAISRSHLVSSEAEAIQKWTGYTP